MAQTILTQKQQLLLDLLSAQKDEQKWSFDDLRKKARMKFDSRIDPLQMAQQLLQVTEVKDYPHMLIEVDNNDWINFWIREVEKMKSEILK